MSDNKIQPCKWCTEQPRMRPRFLDRDGCTVEASSDSGIYTLAHAYDDAWWPCLASGQEIRIFVDRADLASRSAAVATPDVEAIVNELFQNHFGEQATRLELKQANGQHGERELGGWGRDAVKQIILKHCGAASVPSNSAVVAMRWEPIETAPKDGRRILLHEGEGVFQGYWDRESENEGGQCWREEGLDMQRCFPIHWMTLPDPPELPKEEGE